MNTRYVLTLRNVDKWFVWPSIDQFTKLTYMLNP